MVIAGDDDHLPDFPGIFLQQLFGVGDVDDIMSRNPQGVLIDGWNSADYAAAIEKMLKLPPDGRSQSRQMACKMFSLENGVAAYDIVYERVMCSV